MPKRMLLLILLAGCASKPPRQWVTIRDMGVLTREALRKMQLACAEICLIDWRREGIPVYAEGRKAAEIPVVTARFPIGAGDAGALLSVIEASRRLGRAISYEEQEGGITCDARACTLKLRIAYGEPADVAAPVQVRRLTMQGFVRGALGAVAPGR